MFRWLHTGKPDGVFNFMENEEIVRNADVGENFTIVGNNIIKDDRLSIEARFVLIYMRSFKKGWVFYKKDLQLRLKIGRRIIDRCFDELSEVGYLLETEIIKNGSLFPTKGYAIYPYSIKDNPITLYSTDVQNVQGKNTESLITQETSHVQNVQGDGSFRVQNVHLINTNNIYSDKIKKESKNEDRKEWLKKGLEPFLEKYGKEMLNSFYLYWTEGDKTGKKMRFESEKFFDISRRLVTWHSRNVNNGKFAAPVARPAQNTSALANQDNHSNYADYVAWCYKNNITPEPERP